MGAPNGLLSAGAASEGGGGTLLPPPFILERIIPGSSPGNGIIISSSGFWKRANSPRKRNNTSPKHRNGAVGDVLLRFKGEYTRFQNPDDDMVIPAPDAGAMPIVGSRMNNAGNVPPYHASRFHDRLERSYSIPDDE